MQSKAIIPALETNEEALFILYPFARAIKCTIIDIHPSTAGVRYDAELHLPTYEGEDRGAHTRITADGRYFFPIIVSAADKLMDDEILSLLKTHSVPTHLTPDAIEVVKSWIAKEGGTVQEGVAYLLTRIKF
ncbi:hypothetical protein F0L74_06000 [Chitinophaga agrisoli]|uniref:Uncharacterized protein n=1 Tax=Chitinophaga agrisoli TaxID=2607653 RepID=A0A5B2W5L7_9BACT|nr:hypothetical protein [Chitinophaga agrisoli]KAA2245509.1 hypothetical protein F0L74_06000 [Chitinophaga agrisoli]